MGGKLNGAKQSKKKKGKAPAIERKLLQEREFPESRCTRFYAKAGERYKFAKLLEPRTEGNEALVRRFYQEAEHLKLISRAKHPETGVLLHPFITSEVIKAHYALPDVEKCEYSANAKRITSQLRANIRGTIMKARKFKWSKNSPNGDKWYLSKAGLTDEAKVWFHFISSNIMPSTHQTTIKQELALLIYLFITEKDVQTENIILESLTKAACKPRDGSALIFPHLISDRYSAHSIVGLPTDKYFQVRERFSYDCVQKNLSPDDPMEADVSESHAPALPDTLQVSLQAIHDAITGMAAQINELNTRVDTLATRLDESVRKQREFEADMRKNWQTKEVENQNVEEEVREVGEDGDFEKEAAEANQLRVKHPRVCKKRSRQGC